MKTLRILLIALLVLPLAAVQASEPEPPAKEAKKGKGKHRNKARKPALKVVDAIPDKPKQEAPKQETAKEEKPELNKEEQELARIEKEMKKFALQKAYLEAREALAKAELKQRYLKQHMELEEKAAEFNLEKNKLELEMAHSKLEVQKLTAELELMAKRKEFEATKRKEKLDKQLAELKEKESLITAKNNLRNAEITKDVNEIKLLDMQAKSDRYAMDAKIAKIEFDARRRSSEEKAEQSVDRQAITYTKKPHQGRTLIISDRRIQLDGMIDTRSADRVVDRINYFNNKNNEFPIFIVINRNPGGSVMAGYRILKAMEGSQAPVYTVVKSYAASMAATIATLSEKSFAYPNAVILHHQIASMTYGNLTQQTEHVEEMNEWWRRLATPIAKKMGIGLDEFITRMYKNDSGGDWNEFADQASELNWVDHIVDEIRETSLIKNPDAKSSTPTPMIIPIRRSGEEGEAQGSLRLDAQGREYYQLPKLDPFDYWYLYNPQGYYRP